MTELGLAGAVLVASLTLTYVFCLRPMRRGHCSMGAGHRQSQGVSEMLGRDAEIARLRQAVSVLRSKNSAGSEVLGR